MLIGSGRSPAVMPSDRPRGFDEGPHSGYAVSGADNLGLMESADITATRFEEIVFVNLSPSGRPEPHGSEITYDRDRIPTHHLTETLSQD